MVTYDPTLLRTWLEGEEGIKDMVYHDSRGILSFAIGHNLAIKQTSFVIDAVYSCDIIGCEKSLDNNISWWRSLDAVRQGVLMDLMFNMGWGGAVHGLGSFHNMLEDLRLGNYVRAAQGLAASTWSRQVQSSRVLTLVNALKTGRP